MEHICSEQSSQSEFWYAKARKWNKWFAWHPVKTVSGRFVWMKPCERRLVGVIQPQYEYRLRMVSICKGDS